MSTSITFSAHPTHTLILYDCDTFPQPPPCCLLAKGRGEKDYMECSQRSKKNIPLPPKIEPHFKRPSFNTPHWLSPGLP